MPNDRSEKTNGFPPPTTTMALTPATRDLLFALKERFAVSSLAAVVSKLATDASEKVEVLFTPQEMLAIRLRLGVKETPGDAVRRMLREMGAFDVESAPPREVDL